MRQCARQQQIAQQKALPHHELNHRHREDDTEQE